MWIYLIKRFLHALPILIGVNLITFALFFIVNHPDEVARINLGGKYVTDEAIEDWKAQHGYNKPLFYNATEKKLEKLTQTIFFEKSVKLFVFDFGASDSGVDIGTSIENRMWPSLMIAVPTLLIGLFVNITIALLMVMFKPTYLDPLALIACVILMSISALFYIVIGQYLFGKIFRFVPISGFDFSFSGIRFVILPVVIGVISGIGAGARWYRTIFLGEAFKEYVTTARAKGLSHFQVLYKHILKNGLIPILTGVVVVLPSLFLGSLIMESFFGIPGLGSYTIEAIQQQDFAIVRAMVFLGAILYILGLLLTDITYTLADPRVRLRD